ncbi:MAG: regulatory iron-sulfur-containing complex subunit RicT [Anaerolineales bacterium]
MTDRVRTHRFAGVRFQEGAKVYFFSMGALPDVNVGDYVIVSTNRGREMGRVTHFPDDPGVRSEEGSKPIERAATPTEIVEARMWQRRELEAMIECRAKAAEIGLKGVVKIVRAEYAYDGSRLVFLYSTDGDEKVDLGELRKAMQAMYPASRVDARQIGPRDVAKILGGMGACGLEERCCSMFLSEFSPISIKMAKAQGISLNPQEITGMCGRLRCCLVYEYEQYVEARKTLPKKNKRVVTPMGEGKVLEVFPLKQAVLVELGEGKRAEFLKHELQPFDELKALQTKAQGPCDRHENGGCDCGKAPRQGE